MSFFDIFDIELNTKNSFALREQVVDVDNSNKELESEDSKKKNLAINEIIFEQQNRFWERKSNATNFILIEDCVVLQQKYVVDFWQIYQIVELVLVLVAL